MLRRYGIENFKCFGSLQSMDFAPITLIYGRNSSGKSSLIQSLLLLKQSFQGPLRRAHDLDPKGALVDLGAFSSLIHRHDNGAVLRLAVSFAMDSMAGHFTAEVDMAFRSDLPHTATWEELRDHWLRTVTNLRLGDSVPPIQDTTVRGYMDAITIRLLSENGEPVLTLPLVRDGHSEEHISQSIAGTLLRHRAYKLATAADASTLATQLESTQWQEVAPRSVTDQLGELHQQIREVQERRLRAEMERVGIIDEIQALQRSINDLGKHATDMNMQQALQSLASANAVLSQQQAHYLDMRRREAEARLSSLKHHEESLTNRLRSDLQIDSTFAATNRHALIQQLQALRLEGGPLPQPPMFADSRWRTPEFIVLRWLLDDVQQHFMRFLDSVSFIGPLRRQPSRLYDMAAAPVQFVGQEGENMPALLNESSQEDMELINQWLCRLDIQYSLNVRTRDLPPAGAFLVLSLRDPRGVEVTPCDVGFGVGQILPILVEGVRGTSFTTCIMQPELHIHPRLQAELADFFIETAIPPQVQPFQTPSLAKQWVIETHSEALMLRIQRRVREGKLSKDDVSVLYIDDAGGTSRVLRLRLDDRGRFIDEWPGGFFEESFRELFPEG